MTAKKRKEKKRTCPRFRIYIVEKWLVPRDLTQAAELALNELKRKRYAAIGDACVHPNISVLIHVYMYICMKFIGHALESNGLYIV